jgi:hypothetical protein
VRAQHLQLARLGVHRLDEGAQAAAIVARDCVRGPILGRHERKMQKVFPAQLRADQQARGRGVLHVAIERRDLDQLIERLLAFERDQRGHQLGDRGYRHDLLRLLGVQDRRVGFVHDQDRARAQVEPADRGACGVWAGGASGSRLGTGEIGGRSRNRGRRAARQLFIRLLRGFRSGRVSECQAQQSGNQQSFLPEGTHRRSIRLRS